jgi:hypothetical protein
VSFLSFCLHFFDANVAITGDSFPFLLFFAFQSGDVRKGGEALFGNFPDLMGELDWVLLRDGWDVTPFPALVAALATPVLVVAAIVFAIVA